MVSYGITGLERVKEERAILVCDILFQKDGVPCHYGVIVQDYLNDSFPNRWIWRDQELRI